MAVTTSLHGDVIGSESGKVAEVPDSDASDEARKICRLAEDFAPTNSHVHYYVHIMNGHDNTYHT